MMNDTDENVTMRLNEFNAQQMQYKRLQSDWQTMNEAMFRMWLTYSNDALCEVTKQHLQDAENHIVEAMALVTEQSSRLLEQMKSEEQE